MTSLLDFYHYPLISDNDKNDIKEKIRSFLDNFITLFTKMTDKKIVINVKEINELTFNETYMYMEENFSKMYTRELIDNHDQLFISVSKEFTRNFITGCKNDNDTFSKKAILDHFVIDIFKQLITKNPTSDFREVKQTSFINKREETSNMMINIHLYTTYGPLLLSSTINGWRKLLATKKYSYTKEDISLHNALIIIDEINVNEEKIKTLKKGEKLIFPKESKPLLIKDKVNKGNVNLLVTEDNHVAISFKDEINEENYFENNSNNLFILMGTTQIDETTPKNEEIIFPITLCEDLPLLYDNKIIALGEYIPSLYYNCYKITKILKEAIPLK